jgi:membrane protein implicated in regulation of membrane protease activity
MRAFIMPTFVKYLLFQVPEWILVLLVLAFLSDRIDFPRWIGPSGLFAIWVIKDLALYPLLRRAYESKPPDGVDGLIGARGVAQQELSPRGYVRIRGELWMAEFRWSGRRIPQGSPIRVLGARGRTLIVEGEEG